MAWKGLALNDAKQATVCGRRALQWRLRRRQLAVGERTLVMAILNVTPDSFSDGGAFANSAEAVTRALELLDAGADLVDVGGESTRPGATAVAAREEQVRVLPVLRGILKLRPEAILSVDTYHAETARAAVDAGAEIVNDVSGHLWDPGMSQACAELGCGAVLTHTRGRPGEWASLPPLDDAEVLPMVLRELADRVEAATAVGASRECLAIDPGFGFGKRFGENLPLLAGLSALGQLRLPVVVGVSRKGFLRRALAEAGAAEHCLEDATTAANVAAILAGAHVLRVHEVARAHAAAAVADRILAATQAVATASEAS